MIHARKFLIHKALTYNILEAKLVSSKLRLYVCKKMGFFVWNSCWTIYFSLSIQFFKFSIHIRKFKYLNMLLSIQKIEYIGKWFKRFAAMVEFYDSFFPFLLILINEYHILREVEKCHFTYVTEFVPSKEEVCDENFQKQCQISFRQQENIFILLFTPLACNVGRGDVEW